MVIDNVDRGPSTLCRVLTNNASVRRCDTSEQRCFDREFAGEVRGESRERVSINDN